MPLAQCSAPRLSFKFVPFLPSFFFSGAGIICRGDRRHDNMCTYVHVGTSRGQELQAKSWENQGFLMVHSQLAKVDLVTSVTRNLVQPEPMASRYQLVLWKCDLLRSSPSNFGPICALNLIGKRRCASLCFTSPLRCFPHLHDNPHLFSPTCV